MSRGLGPTQRRVLDVLLEYDGWAVETTELKHLVAGDRFNPRRAVRGLLRRRMVHEWSEGGQRYYELSILGWIRACLCPLRTRRRGRPIAPRNRCVVA